MPISISNRIDREKNGRRFEIMQPARRSTNELGRILQQSSLLDEDAISWPNEMLDAFRYQ
jgi:hypothetical protein